MERSRPQTRLATLGSDHEATEAKGGRLPTSPDRLPTRSQVADRARQVISEVFTVRWHPNADLAAVGISWVLLVGALSAATFVATPTSGIPYFLLYGILGAGISGFAIPVFWMVWV